MFRLDAAGPWTRALLAVRVTATTGARRRRQHRHGVRGVSVFTGRRAAVSQSFTSILLPALLTLRRAFTHLVTRLVIQQLDEEVDVLHGEAQDLVLAELLVRRVGRDEFAKLRERTIYVLLPPAFAAVSEDTPSQLLRRTIIEIQFEVCGGPSLHTSVPEDPKAPRWSKERAADEGVCLQEGWRQEGRRGSRAGQ